MHGGKHPRGIASPAYKHGRYSKALPERLAARYEQARTDGQLLELREEVSLVDARIGELLGRIDTGETRDTWTALRATYTDLRVAMQARDTGAVQGALVQLDKLITQGGDEFVVWEQIERAIEQRRRLVESERKRLIETQQTITAERAMVLLTAILGIVKEHVTDRGQLEAIATAVRSLALIEPGG